MDVTTLSLAGLQVSEVNLKVYMGSTLKASAFVSGKILDFGLVSACFDTLILRS